MQCHGGLKGPLRRIIRSLGNDPVGSACRQTPRRNLTGGRATSSPPERCNSLRDDDRPLRPLDAPFPPQSRGPVAPESQPPQGHTTQNIPPASHSRPEREEEEAAHDDRQSDWRKQPKLASSRPSAISHVDQNASSAVSEGFTPSSFNKECHQATEKSSNRLMTRKTLAKAPIKDGQDFSERYNAKSRRGLISRERNQSRAHQMQQERHHYPGSEDWRVILRMLDANTPAGSERYKKKLETVMLPKGILARFNGIAGASLKEIMEHTGCHVQIARGGTQITNAADIFAGLDLLGSSSQITHALKILPQYLDVMSTEEVTGTHASGGLNDHVLERTKRSDEEMRLAGLSAPDDAGQRDQASAEETDVEHDENKLYREEDEPASISTPIRSIWAEDRTRKLSMYDVLDERQKSLTTPLKVSAYVADLCQDVPRGLHRALYKSRRPLSKRDHVQIVEEKLVKLFSTPGIASMVTSYAVDRAIGFLAKHNNFAAFRGIYNALEEGGYTFTASNWNRCLAAAAVAGDVHNYRYTLKVMLRHGTKPNPMTWATLHDLMCRRFPLDSAFVVETMRDKGLLWHYGAAQLVAQGSVTNDLKAHLASRGRLATFFKWYDNRFSSGYGLESFNWLTVDVVNRMVAVLISHGQTRNAFEVLSEFRRRNGEKALDTVTLNTFLTSSLRDGDPQSAVATLQHFRVGEPGALVPDSVSYTILFSIAWRRRYFNMLRVIWRYASATGQIGFNMRHRIQKNLNFIVAQEDKSRGDVWRTFAAKFVIGTSDGWRHSPKDKDNAVVAEDLTLNALESQLLCNVSLGSLPKDSPQFEERRNFFSRVLTDDLTQVGLSRPAIPLAELLKAAWQKDREWKERGLGLPRNYNENTFREMLEDGIKVPMEEGHGKLETRAWEVPALLRQVSTKEATADVKEYAEGGETHDVKIEEFEAKTSRLSEMFSDA